MTFQKKGFKFIGYFIIGVVFYGMLLLINPWDYPLTKEFVLEVLRDLAVTFIGVLTIMESSFWVSKKLDKHFPWRSALTKRIFIQIGILMVIVSSVLFLSRLLIPDAYYDETTVRQVFVTGTVMCILFSAVFTAASFFIQWNTATVTLVKYEEKVAKAELEFLKMQIDPHFLFNNFSTLTSLIEEDSQLAVEYVQQLSNIYRHVLKDKEHHVVPLKEELEFIRSYLFLYEARYQESLMVKIDIPDSLMNKGIATATMQLLVENAIKHNSISRQSPLKIEILADQDGIVIKNNINPVTTQRASKGIGLKNITERYQLLGNEVVSIKHDDDFFWVRVPFLELKR